MGVSKKYLQEPQLDPTALSAPSPRDFCSFGKQLLLFNGRWRR